MKHSEHDLSRYATMVQALAQHAVQIAVDASPHQPRPGETRYSLIHLLPAAEHLLGQPHAPLDPPPVASAATFTDGRGQSRPIYRPFAAYLHHRATGQFLTFQNDPGDDISRQLWHAWHQLARGDADAIDRVHRLVDTRDGCLHPQTLNEPPDHWTYRELVGLHALHALVEFCDASEDLPEPTAWRQRILDITNYHQHHTQPDYTTYQPWGLAAFLSNPDTILFAEQQLHDTQTHLQIEGGPGALLPALLLADASASLSCGFSGKNK